MLKRWIWMFACVSSRPAGAEDLVANIAGQRFEFVRIKPGKFVMGSDTGTERERPAHQVHITKPFQMGKFEITMEQWDAIMEKNPSGRRLKGKTLPLDSVTWDEAQEFIGRLNQKDHRFRYRLPTEAEWEYACRAGRKKDFPQDLDSQAFWSGNSGTYWKNLNQPGEVLIGPKMPTNIGSKRPNPWGLHDMQGNVWEWVQDWYAPHAGAEARDPRGPETGTTKVFKGASWLNWGLDKAEVQPSYRDHRKLGFRHTDLGFRLVRTPAAKHVAGAASTLYVSASEGSTATIHEQMRASKKVLEENGFRLSDVVSSHIWVTDIRAAGEVSKEFRRFFKKGAQPAGTISEVSALPGGATINVALTAARGTKKIIRPDPALPFSPAVLAGDTLYISGQTGAVPFTGKLAGGDIKAQVARSLENIGAILHEAGLDFSNVAQANVILTNPAGFGPMGEVYRTFTTQPRPARVPLGATRLPAGALVSITMTARTAKGTAVLPAGMEPSENYSRGYLAADTLYVAGIGSAKTSLEEGMDEVLGRVKAIVEAAKMSLGDVVEARVYLNDIRNFDAMDRVYRRYFGTARSPARATVAVENLPANLTVMTSFVAVRSGR